MATRGRTEYDPNRHPRMAKALARNGYTDAQMAEIIGVTRKTICAWKTAHPAFGEALTIGKEEVDLQVEDGLLKRALGYDYEETEIVASKEGDTTKPAKIKKTKKHVPADVTACIFWLKNRQPGRWRDKHQTEVTGKDGGPIEVTSPREQITSRIAGIAARIGQEENTK